MNDIILEIKDLCYTYPDGTEALKDINLSIKKGEKVAIMGPNGAGKSTLFSHFNGLTKPTSGHIEINGKSISYEKKELLKVRQKVGIVFQNPNDQLFAPTVKEDIAFGPMNLGLNYDEVTERVEEALRMVGMEGYENKSPHHLSGGQQKRISIAGIVAMRPEIMILDEPTASLDPKGVNQVINILNKLNIKEDMSIIISSHDVEMISGFAEKIFVLNEGKIIADGPTVEILSNLELLNNAKLNPPKTIEILNILKNNGVNIKTDIISVQETCEEILKLLK